MLAILPCLVVFAGCRGLSPPTWTSSAVVQEVVGRGPVRERQEAWDRWAADHLQSGDIVFVFGESRILLGLVNFSKLSTEIAGSQFSHVGLVSRENGRVWVYDIVSEGPRRLPFGRFMTDDIVWSIAVKRLQAPYRAAIPTAIAYCREQFDTKRKFDTDFRLDNDRLYCSEMVEGGFRQAGLTLSQPVRIDQLPHFDRLGQTTKQLIRTASKIEFDQEILLPGNDTIGLWACPYLDLVVPPLDGARPPETR